MSFIPGEQNPCPQGPNPGGIPNAGILGAAKSGFGNAIRAAAAEELRILSMENGFEVPGEGPGEPVGGPPAARLPR